MAGFGGAVKLTGESEYRKALRSITQELKEVDSSLKVVATQYDKADKSQEALNATSVAYQNKLEAQSKKLQVLIADYKSLSAQADKNIEKHAQLKDALDRETAKLQDIEKTSGKTSDEYKAQAAIVSDLAGEYKKSTVNIENQELALSKARSEINNTQADINKTNTTLDQLAKELDESGSEADDLGDSVKDAGKEASDAASGGFTVFKGILADLGATAIKSAISGLKSLGASIVDVGKQAIGSYADYEQLVGGVETLFGTGGKSAEEYAEELGVSVETASLYMANSLRAQERVLQDAQNAYRETGMSANEYMETVTSFSASLIASVGGNQEVAAAAANQALKDMSDNANKMGSDLQSLQNAYQGFAKGNFNMLDNLKLGYGGTKEEMERLLKDAEKLSGVKYNINNLNDLYSAIHVIQTEMGITGTTAEEAATTIAGSTQMMSASWQNLLTGIADDNADFDTLINNFIESVMAVATNLIPRIQTTIEGMAKLASGLLEKLVPQLVKMIPPLLTQTMPILISAVQTAITSILNVLPQIMPVISALIPKIVTTLVSMLPQVLDAGIQILMSLIQGISDTIPELLGMLPDLISDLVDVITNNLPLIIETGINLLNSFIEGIVKAIPALIAKLPEIIDKVVTTILQNLPKIIDAGTKLLLSLIDGIDKIVPQLVEQMPIIIEKLVTAISENLPQIIESGVKLITSVISGITKTIPKLIEQVPKMIEDIVSSFSKNLYKIVGAGMSIIDSIISGAKTVWNSITGFASDLFNAVVNGIKGLPDSIKKIGGDLVRGLWNGINEMKDWVLEKVKGFGSSVLKGIKKVFGISSPSKVFRDEVGKNLALGLGDGFSEEMVAVSKEMQDSIPTSFDVGAEVESSSGYVGGGLDYFSLVNAFKEALGDMDVTLDDQKVGKFVQKTVTDAIYN